MLFQNEEEHLAFKVNISIAHEYLWGDLSRFEYCIHKLNRDALLVSIGADQRVLIELELAVVSSFVDRLGLMGMMLSLVLLACLSNL